MRIRLDLIKNVKIRLDFIRNVVFLALNVVILLGFLINAKIVAFNMKIRLNFRIIVRIITLFFEVRLDLIKSGKLKFLLANLLFFYCYKRQIRFKIRLFSLKIIV